jgi:alpha-ketoglutarate-dependent 2,4-dichlorophenoxyacetate dioxygenase
MRESTGDIAVTLSIRSIHPLFVAEVGGVQICDSVDVTTYHAIRAAFEEHQILVFRGQRLDDEGQMAFSRLFGDLQKTLKVNPGVGSYFARQSNLDLKSSEFIPEDDRRMLHAKANMLWHSDSSYRDVPALCSLLAAHLVPPVGGNTEFATMRGGYEALPEGLKQRIQGLRAEHSLMHSRSLVDPRALNEEMRAELGYAQHLLVRRNPVNGRKSLFVSAHASHIIGWPLDQGRALLKELTDFTTAPRFVYSHSWKVGDMVLWDNRCTLHRATPFELGQHKRLLQRTTVEGDPNEYRQEVELLAA